MPTTSLPWGRPTFFLGAMVRCVRAKRCHKATCTQRQRADGWQSINRWQCSSCVPYPSASVGACTADPCSDSAKDVAGTTHADPKRSPRSPGVGHILVLDSNRIPLKHRSTKRFIENTRCTRFYTRFRLGGSGTSAAHHTPRMCACTKVNLMQHVELVA
jgi:hypothetical protein